MTGSIKVLVVDPIDGSSIATLSRRYDVTVRMGPTADELSMLLRQHDVLIMRSGVRVTAQMISGASSLRLIVRAGAGMDNIDTAAAAGAGIEVLNVPGESSRAVAELAFGLSLSVARRISLADAQVRRDQWRKGELMGIELGGRTAGVVGLGGIGRELSDLAIGFGMRVLAAVAKPTSERRTTLARRGVELVQLADLLCSSDLVVVAVPLNNDTRGLIDGRMLARMRRSAILINVSRGPVVPENDLYNALEQRQIAGAGVDVYESEGQATALSKFPNVVLTPHIGAMTREAQRRVGNRVVALIDEAINGVGGEPPEDEQRA